MFRDENGELIINSFPKEKFPVIFVAFNINKSYIGNMGVLTSIN